VRGALLAQMALQVYFHLLTLQEVVEEGGQVWHPRLADLVVAVAEQTLLVLLR
jgi:hypothetical protein